MPISNRGLAGQPTLPYIDYRVLAGVDAFVDLTFLDHTMTPVVPTSITYELDDITNNLTMVAPGTVLVPTGSSQTLQLPGSVLTMSYPYQGSQLCQLVVRAVVVDSVTAQPSNIAATFIIELVAIQTPSGM